MGETLPLFEPRFNRSVKLESRPERLSSDAGGILLREALERLHVVEDLAEKLEDPRDPTRIEHSLEELLRTMLIAQALGWEDQSDVDALRDDPVLAIARSDRRGRAAAGKALASQPTLSRLLDPMRIARLETLFQLEEHIVQVDRSREKP